MEYNKLATGEICTLSAMFSKDNVVIIPDLQRDFCWGTKRGDKELVRDFVRNIVNDGFNKNTDLSLGLIYGYEAPIGHIQLCDGQQRITTLFLLLGLINKKSNNAFQNQLISIFEFKEDDKEPYLQYSIRESSLYFLSDLVCNFFIAKNDLVVSDINSQFWYFGDYNLDPSIQSMLNALAIIENEIKDIDAARLGKYLVNHLSFIYYDMGNRTNGEETFVVINTTGEPLSTTENLKPLFINAQKIEDRKDCSEKWEEWETWFWKMRTGSGKKENDTAENGFREFLRWITLLKTSKVDDFKKIQESGHFDFDINIDVVEIDNYFKIVKFSFEESNIFKNNLDWLAPDKKDKNINTQITWFRLLPVIEYVKRFGNEDNRNIIRVKTFFKNLSRIDNISKAVGSLLQDAIIIINMISVDIAEIVNLPKVSTQILTEEERRKFNIFIANSEMRVQIEDAFWKSEEHNIWKGEIFPLINWATVNGEFDFYKFKEFDKMFRFLYHDTLEYPELDITRRALLTRGLKGYPRIFRGYTNTSFCWEYSDWQILIKDNEVEFGEFLKDLISASNINDQLQKMIHDNSPEKDWDEFVKIPELLAYCKQKNIQWDSQKGWLLVHGQKTSGAYANLKSYRLYLDLKSAPIWDSTAWNIDFYSYEGTCTFFDNKLKNIAIDINYCGTNLYKIQVFRRNLKSEVGMNDLTNLANSLNFTWNGKRYESDLHNLKNIIELLKSIFTSEFIL